MTVPVELSDGALRHLCDWFASVRNSNPYGDWIHGLVFSPRGLKCAQEDEWTELGVGFTAVVWTREQVPPDAISLHGGLEIIIHNSSGDPNAFEGKEVDVIGDDFVLVDAQGSR